MRGTVDLVLTLIVHLKKLMFIEGIVQNLQKK